MIALAVLVGCASSSKLARKSQEQLAEGEVQKAYRTALKAVKKDPYNEAARYALSAAGSSLLAHELQILRGVVQADTVEAAEVAMRMAAIRNETALNGVSLPIDSLAAAEQSAVRAGAARVYMGLGDDAWVAGDPKEAYGYFLAARRFTPDSAELGARIEDSYDDAVDVVLVLPVIPDSRAWINRRELSDRIYEEIAEYAEDELRYTEILKRGPVWERLLDFAPGELTRDMAYQMAFEEGATRVLSMRIYGDRVDSRQDTFEGVLYRKVTRTTDKGPPSTGWEETRYRAGIHDIWASVAMDCEIYDLVDEQLIVRRTSEHSAGLRALHSSSNFPGSPGDYTLCTPAMEDSDKQECSDIRWRWSRIMGKLSVRGFVELARDEPRIISLGPSNHFGSAPHGKRTYPVYYGVPPVETQLILNALRGSWREVALVLQESDQH
jgi:hypothetical protein